MPPKQVKGFSLSGLEGDRFIARSRPRQTKGAEESSSAPFVLSLNCKSAQSPPSASESAAADPAWSHPASRADRPADPGRCGSAGAARSCRSRSRAGSRCRPFHENASDHVWCVSDLSFRFLLRSSRLPQCDPAGCTWEAGFPFRVAWPDFLTDNSRVSGIEIVLVLQRPRMIRLDHLSLANRLKLSRIYAKC